VVLLAPDGSYLQEIASSMSDSALSASRKKKRPLMIILLLLIAIGACGAAGYAWWMLHKQ